MQNKSWIVMRILVNRFHPKNVKEFLNLLPSDDAKQIFNQDAVTTDIDSLFVKPQEFLKNIHYSWVAPHVQKFPKHMQELVVSALPNPLAAGLKKYLEISTLSTMMPTRAKAFFLKELYDQIKQPSVLPFALLPKNNLSVLLNLSRQELVNLVDFLGLYDLTEEVKQIVDKKDLQRVYVCLDNKKLQFIRTCLHQKNKLAQQKLDLQKWNGDKAELLQTLHKRGLYRLGKALSGSSPDFLWHFMRRFDTVRSSILEKYCNKQSIQGVTSSYVQQVINVLNFLKEKSPK